MNIHIKKFRERRLKRLLNRFDADDINWITLENGEHAPIDGSGAVTGGPLKGVTLSKAKSTVSKSALRKKREKEKETAFQKSIEGKELFKPTSTYDKAKMKWIDNLGPLEKMVSPKEGDVATVVDNEKKQRKFVAAKDQWGKIKWYPAESRHLKGEGIEDSIPGPAVAFEKGVYSVGVKSKEDAEKEEENERKEKEELGPAGTPTHKLHYSLKGAKTYEEKKKALREAEPGAKVYITIGSKVVGYTKKSKDSDGHGYYDRWEISYGNGDYEFTMGTDLKGTKSSDFLLALSSKGSPTPEGDGEVYTSLKEAEKHVTHKYGKVDPQYGRLRGITHSSVDKIQQNRSGDEVPKGNFEYAVYEKSVSGTKELTDHISDRDALFMFKHKLEEEGIIESAYKSKDDFSVEKKGGKIIGTWTQHISQGKGKKKKTVNTTFELTPQGYKRTYVGNDGKPIYVDYGGGSKTGKGGMGTIKMKMRKVSPDE